MVRKAVGQVSLVEALLPAAFGSNQRLERIRVDWAPIETLLQPMRRGSAGRSADPPLVQLRALPFLLDGKAACSIVTWRRRLPID